MEIADMIISCSLDTGDEKLNKIVSEVQQHHHTKSCKKYNGTCRYGFPRLPSKKTLVSQPLKKDMDEKKRKEKKEWAKNLLVKAKDILEDPKLDNEMTLDQFI